MTVVKGRTETVGSPQKMSVITNSILLARRIRGLQRRRQGLVATQEQIRAQLPDWAVEPLRLVGMTNEEVRGLVDDRVITIEDRVIFVHSLSRLRPYD